MSTKISTTTRSKSSGLTEFDAVSVRTILAEAETALRAIADKHGLTLDRKGRTYRKDALPVMFQFLIKEADANGNAMTSETKDFVKYAELFGFKPEDLGREFTNARGTYRVIGLLPRSRKAPILVEDVRTGKKWKFTVEVVLIGLGGARALSGLRSDRSDAKFRVGHGEKDESLRAWISARKGHKITSGWKEEMITAGGMCVGPLIVYDKTEQDADPRVTKGAIGIPFGAPYRGETEWMPLAEARQLATTLGLTFKGED